MLKEWEAVIAGCSAEDQRQDMTIQWIHLTEWSSMTARDRLLHRSISERFSEQAFDPLGLRDVVLQVDEAFADSEEDRSAIQAAMAHSRHERFAAYVSLLSEATRQCGIAIGDGLMSRANNALLVQAIQAGQVDASSNISSLTVRVFDYLAQQAGLPFQEVSKRIEELSGLMAPIGAINLASDPGAKQEGHLAMSYARLRSFMEQVQDHERVSGDSDANEALLVLFSAKEFCDFVSERLAGIEQTLSSFIVALRKMKETREDIDDLVNDIAYALDGWDGLIDVWNEAATIAETEEGGSARRRAIQHILLFLPMMPAEETYDDSERVWNGISIHRAVMVRQFTNWLNDTLDSDLVARVQSSQEMERRRARYQQRAAAREAEAKAREERRRQRRQERRAVKATAEGAV